MKLHHRPLFLFAISYIVGIIFASKTAIHPALVLSTVFFLIAIPVILRDSPAERCILVILGCLFAASFLRTSALLRPPLDDVSNYALGKKVFLAGMVVSDPSIKVSHGVGFTLEAKQIRTYTGVRKASGNVAVGILPPMDGSDIERWPMYGEEITVHGRLELPREPSNPGEPSMRERLLCRGIRCVLSTPADQVAFNHHPQWSIERNAGRFRESFRGISQRLFSKPYSELLPAVILGDCTSLPNDIRNAFTRTGTVHIIVPSGYNLAVIAAILGLILLKTTIPRSWRNATQIASIWGFVLLAGGGPSITRAAIMMTAVLMAYLVKRANDALNALFFSCILLLAANPLQLYEDGFLLTFASVAAIILSLPLLRWMDSKIFGEGLGSSTRTWQFVIWCARTAVASLAISVVVFTAVWPIVVCSSNYLQLLTIPANALTVLPVFGITILGSLALIAGSICGPLGVWIAPGVLFMMRLMLGVVQGLSSLSWCVVSVPTPPSFCVLFYYVALLGVVEHVSRKTQSI